MGTIIQSKPVLTIKCNPWEPNYLNYIYDLEESKEYLRKVLNHIQSDSCTIIHIYQNGVKINPLHFSCDTININDFVLIKVIPTEGGGSRKKPSRMIVIEVMAVDALVPGALGLGLAGLRYFATSSAIMVGGGLLINTVLPFQPNVPRSDSL